MSIEALARARKIIVGSSSLKFIFFVMADYANERDEMRCWPSIKELCDVTEMDRKTIINALASLEELGYLVDTGDRRGKTKQIKVFRLSKIERQEDGIAVAEDEAAAQLDTTSSGSGERVPKTEPSQISRQRVPNFPRNSPKNGTRNSKGTVSEQSVATDKEKFINKKSEPLEVVVHDADARRARKGEAGYDPELYDGECLPSGWYGIAETFALPMDHIYKSWERFKDRAAMPWSRPGWRAWVSRETGARSSRSGAAGTGEAGKAATIGQWEAN